MSILCRYLLFDQSLAWICQCYHSLRRNMAKMGRNCAYHILRFLQHCFVQKWRSSVGGDPDRDSLNGNSSVTRCLGDVHSRLSF
jgi:hypothetical protein